MGDVLIVKKCSKCKLEKEFIEFNKDKSSKDGYQYNCRLCAKQYRDNDIFNRKKYAKKYRSENASIIEKKRKLYAENNKGEMREYQKNYYLKNMHNLTVQQYEEMVISQDNRCAICGIHACELKRNLVIDHCHTTGKVRGLLCDNCNKGLGFFQDDASVLQKATDYKTKHDEKIIVIVALKD